MKCLPHINASHPNWHLPVETVHEVSDHDLKGRDRKVHPLADPSPNPEWKELKVISFEVDVVMTSTYIHYEGSRSEYIHVQVLGNMHKTSYTSNTTPPRPLKLKVDQ